MRYVSVLDIEGNVLMPTKPSRARKWIKSGKATPFWNKGIFSVRLNREPSARYKQEISVGIDPGCKMEALTVKSEAHTYLNVQAKAVTHVKDSMDTRAQLRRKRRNTKVRSRKWKNNNRKKSKIPPSVKARWQWKLRLCKWLSKSFPIKTFIVEDTKAKTRPGKRTWNRNFMPLEMGKKWFYEEIRKLGKLITYEGWRTKQFREKWGLHKKHRKLIFDFESHCVDSWVLAHSIYQRGTIPENKELIAVIPYQFKRRRLHKMCPAKGGIRLREGGTRSLGYKRGSYVIYTINNTMYTVSGYNDKKMTISLRNMITGKRYTQLAKLKNIKFICYASWRYHYIKEK
jgi:hypothetical protein